MDRVMFYSGSLTAPSQKRLQIQVAPDKSDVGSDLTLGESADPAVCTQQQRGTEGCGVHRNNSALSPAEDERGRERAADQRPLEGKDSSAATLL